MKKYIFLLSVVLSFLGCEKEMMDYEGKDGIYFSVQEYRPVSMEIRDMGACRYDVDTFLVVVGK